MATQRGNVYIYIGAALAGLALISALFFGAKSYLDGVDSRAFARGQQEAQVAYEKRDNEALQNLNKRIVQLTAEIKEREDKYAADLSLLDTQYQKEKKDAKIRADRAVADVRSGVLRLRDKWRNDALACSAERDRNAGTEATTASGGTTDTGGGELSKELTEFLVSEANRADEVVRKLNQLQVVTKKYLEQINGRNQEVPRTP